MEKRKLTLREKILLKYLFLAYRFYPAFKRFSEYKLATEAISKYKCKKILDIGCGKGNLGMLLENFDMYVGIDLNDMFEKGSDLDFIRADAVYPPLRSSTGTWPFDCVFFVNSVFYFGLEASLNLYSKIARKIFIIDIDKRLFPVRVVDFLEGKIRKNPEEIKAYLAEKGYKIIEFVNGSTFMFVLASHDDELHAKPRLFEARTNKA